MLKGLRTFMKLFSRFVRKQYAEQLLSTPKAGLSDFFQSPSSTLSPACLQAYFPSLLLLFLAFSPRHTSPWCVPEVGGGAVSEESAGAHPHPKWTGGEFTNHSNATKAIDTEEVQKYIFQTTQTSTQMILPFMRFKKKKVHCSGKIIYTSDSPTRYKSMHFRRLDFSA